MKLRKSATLWFICAFALSACENANNIKGTLTVTGSDFRVADGMNKSIDLPTGTVATAHLSMSGNGAVLDISGGNGDIRIPIPFLVKDQQGPISLSAEEMKQNFSVKGEIGIMMRVKDTSHFDRCPYGTTSRSVCNRMGCRSEDETVWGVTWVTESSFVADKKVQLNFLNPSSGEVLAQFSGQYRVSSEVSSHTSAPCAANQEAAAAALGAITSSGIGEIARNADGSARLMNHAEAASYCASQGEHLPTIRELAKAFYPQGIVEMIDYKGQPGCYPVSTHDGDKFYYCGFVVHGFPKNEWIVASSYSDEGYAKGLDYMISADNSGVGVAPDNIPLEVRCAKGQ